MPRVGPFSHACCVSPIGFNQHAAEMCLLVDRIPVIIHDLSSPSHIPLLGSPMSSTNQTAGPSRPNGNFAAIFQAALNEYEKVTRKPLRTHPFATQLDSCDGPQAISNVFQSQSQAFNKFHNGDGTLMAYLGPTVDILFTFSEILGEGIGLVSHFTCPI